MADNKTNKPTEVDLGAMYLLPGRYSYQQTVDDVSETFTFQTYGEMLDFVRRDRNGEFDEE